MAVYCLGITYKNYIVHLSYSKFKYEHYTSLEYIIYLNYISWQPEN